ncbi:phenylalanine--tRNA ligase subunit beta [Daejeonella lutea]|uniref:Phenylalanine--tRNA ligase beta subunit n=1 Tax=Daejeonella lutea TaxID=572036 RepID=A0A1T4ZYN2_9SPHI|nr:phenylalanine--tRNA ligase subunit beta [Daejeonella lutea]SKB27796.1 phenylalanyl-tRNA synthetase beta subunit [Daejeonella lutea]
MKISYKWLQQFIQTDKTPEELSLILTNIGLEVESLEKVQSVPGGLEGLVIGFVKECAQHPNADRLKVTKVDVGGSEDLQIVCGANNVAAGQKVVVATVNTTVHPVSGEPFKINKSKIRGEVSEGMICAEDEIGLGHDHDGIMVLDPDAKVGRAAKDYFNLQDDFVFEIGLTPNRADAASHLGVARDLAGFLQIPLLMPDVSGFKVKEQSLTIPVTVEDVEACPRYSSVSISGIKVEQSPEWLKEKLNAIGVRPINNVVDATNYILHDLGQPLHAFDADAIKGNKVTVKTCPENTVFKTLDEVERKLSADDLMICNAEDPMCIAGVFGGISSGVNLNTSKIFLESAWFNAVSVRKTSKRHGLKTDASFRFERGTDPEMTVLALKKAAMLIAELGGGFISSEISDLYPSPAKPFEIEISFKNVDRLIGKTISVDELRSTLSGLGISIVSETAEGMSLQVPAYKVDVTREVDIIEEILRIHGYDNIEIPTQIKASLNYTAKPDKEVLQNQIADMLTGNGFLEILSNSLTKLSYSAQPELAVKILNPLSSDLDVMRQSLLFSGLEAISYNQNRKNPDLKLYEFGKVYSLAAEGYNENQRLSLFITGANDSENWGSKATQSGFYNLKSAVDLIISRLNIKGLASSETISTNFSAGIVYRKGEKNLVEFGTVSKATLKKLDISGEVFYADFDWDLVIRSVRNNKIAYKEVSKFPSVRRDLSMLLNKEVSFDQLKQIALKTEKGLLKEVNVFDVYVGDKLPAGKKSYALSFLLQDEEKTLADKQIEAIMQKLILNFEKQAGAEIRK